MEKLYEGAISSAQTIRTLNAMAMDYYEMGLPDLSEQIWSVAYGELNTHPCSENRRQLLTVLCCNLATVLRQYPSSSARGRR